VRQLKHARHKFEERIDSFEKQKLEIDKSIHELKSSIGEVDERLADHARRAAQRHVIAAE